MALCTHPKLHNLCFNGGHYYYGKRRRRNGGVSKSSVRMAASSRELMGWEEGELERPKWSGETPVSRLVRALIYFKPLFSLLKLGARQVLISTAEKNNIPRRERTREILESDVYKLMDSIQDPSIIYPDSYFLAVAKFKEMNGSPRENPISWRHANGENTCLPSQSFDLFSAVYVLHECPATAIVNIVKEAFRLLRPGGTVAFTDNSPKSKVIQELPPVMFTLMKSTEPFLDEYYLTDLDAIIKEAGFVNVQTVLTDPRHRTVTATVPY